MDLAPGVSASADLVVGAADTAVALGSGDLPVLGTPRLLALCEAATLRVLDGRLADSVTSVGVAVHLEHRAPSHPGATVTARATLESIQGRRLRFRVEVIDGPRLVATGTVERAIVDRSRFLEGSG